MSVTISGPWIYCPMCKNPCPLEDAKVGPDGVRYCPTCHKALFGEKGK